MEDRRWWPFEPLVHNLTPDLDRLQDLETEAQPPTSGSRVGWALAGRTAITRIVTDQRCIASDRPLGRRTRGLAVPRHGIRAGAEQRRRHRIHKRDDAERYVLGGARA